MALVGWFPKSIDVLVHRSDRGFKLGTTARCLHFPVQAAGTSLQDAVSKLLVQLDEYLKICKVEEKCNPVRIAPEFILAAFSLVDRRSDFPGFLDVRSAPGVAMCFGVRTKKSLKSVLNFSDVSALQKAPGLSGVEQLVKRVA